MALTVTLLQLRDWVRQRADMENSTFVSDTELTDRVNAAIRLVYRKIVKAYGDNYYGTLIDVPTVAGTQSYALPADFMKISAYGVWWITGAGENVRLSRYNPNESLAQYTGQGWTYYPWGQSRANVRYDVFGKQLRLMPLPTAVQTVRVHYIPTPTTLVLDADTFDGIAGFEEAVIWEAVATVLSKQEADPSFALAQRDKELQDLLENIDPDQNEPHTVQWNDQIAYEDS